MNQKQLRRFRDALARRRRRYLKLWARPDAGSKVHEPIQRSELEHGRPPDVLSVRDKSTRHKKQTADKWNQ